MADSKESEILDEYDMLDELDPIMESEDDDNDLEELTEDNPPLGAVLGYRPSDYNVSTFTIGSRIRWAEKKTAKIWNDGVKSKHQMRLPKKWICIFQYWAKSNPGR